MNISSAFAFGISFVCTRSTRFQKYFMLNKNYLICVIYYRNYIILFVLDDDILLTL